MLLAMLLTMLAGLINWLCVNDNKGKIVEHLDVGQTVAKL